MLHLDGSQGKDNHDKQKHHILKHHILELPTSAEVTGRKTDRPGAAQEQILLGSSLRRRVGSKGPTYIYEDAGVYYAYCV